MLPDRMRRAAVPFLLCTISALGLESAAFAQEAPSRTVPDSVAPREKVYQSAIVLPDTRLSAAPDGSGDLKVDVGNIIVDGVDTDLAASIAKITSSVEGRNVSVAQLYEVASGIEAIYASSGRILTRATVPPQDLRDGGDFHIVMVEGFIEEVVFSKVPALVRGPIMRRLAGLIGLKGTKLSEIERRVLLAARVPGVRLTTTLVPGEQLGGARLILEVDHDPVQVTFGVDNSLSDAYDNWSVQAQVSANSLLGVGEQIYLLGMTTTDFDLIGGDPMRRIFGVSAVFPIGADGLDVTAEYLRADTNGTPASGAAAVAGAFDRIKVGLSYPLILSRRETLEVSGGIELINERQTASDFDVRLSQDKLRLLGVGLDWNKAVSRASTLIAHMRFTQGLDMLGARNQGDALLSGVSLSRQGSAPDFSKLGAELSLTQLLAADVNARIFLRGQASLSGALPSAVQFSMDGNEAVSGFSTGTISTDTGATARFDLSRTIQLGGGSWISPFVAAAAGTGQLSQPTAVEVRHPNAWSLSGGLRATIGGRLTLGAELARAHSNLFSKNQTRLSVSAAVQF